MRKLSSENRGQMVSQWNTAPAVLLQASFRSRGILYPVGTTLSSWRENKVPATFPHSHFCFLARTFWWHCLHKRVYTRFYEPNWKYLTSWCSKGTNRFLFSIFFFWKSPNLPEAWFLSSLLYFSLEAWGCGKNHHSAQSPVWVQQHLVSKAQFCLLLWLRGCHLFFFVVVFWGFLGFAFIRRLKGRCVIYGLEAKYYIILWKEQTMQKHTSLAL